MIKQKKRNINDKIFDSSFKRGDIEYQIFDNNISLDKQYEEKYLKNGRNFFDYNTEKDLYLKIYEIWEASKWYISYRHKPHIPKDKLSEIYFDLRTSLDSAEHSNAEIFCAIAEFLNIHYNTLYEMISTKFKIEILKEIKEKYPTHFSNEGKSLF